MGKRENKEFFDFRSQLLTSTFQARAIDLRKGENGKNNHWNLIKGIYNYIKFPVIFKQEFGKNMTDILDTGWPNLYLISNKLKEILDKNSLTGWKTYPIKLYDIKENEISGYHGLSITGRSNSITYDNCEIIEKKLVPNGPICKFYKGMSIKNWDGSDFFTPDATYEILITKKAFDAINKQNITNLNITNLADIETDIDDILN